MQVFSFKKLKIKVEMQEKEGYLQMSIIEVIQDPFFILSRQGKCLKANAKGIKMLGHTWEKLREMVFIDVVEPEDLVRIREGIEEMGKGNEVRVGIYVISKEGERIPVAFFGKMQEGVFSVTLRDLRERTQNEKEWEKAKKEYIEKIQEKDRYVLELQVLKNLYREKEKEVEKMREEAVLLSYIDDLTGVYNHRFFIQQLTLEIERQKRYPNPLSLLMIDIDNFKHYNDTNGHLAGDQALRAIALLIQQGVRQTDIVARYGGEEFSGILINSGEEGAKKIAERVRRNVAETRFPNERLQPNGNLTVSIGVGIFSSTIQTLTDLIRNADNALYRAKRAGRNRVEG
jgi:diguanylate cyclase (GGDEF)-like protein/PAS domain S-box-containing protein